MTAMISFKNINWEQHRSMLQWASDNCQDGWTGRPKGGPFVAAQMMRDPGMKQETAWHFVSEEDETLFKMVWL